MELVQAPDNAEATEIMKDICDYFIAQSKPKSFAPGKENVITSSEKQFESVCANIEENGINAENISVFTFYSKVEHLEKRYQEMMKSYGKNR